MSEQQYATFLKGDPMSIKIVGSGEFVKERVLTLVEDFQEPKFNFNETYDEE